MKNQIAEQVLGIPISLAERPAKRSLGSLLPAHNRNIQCYVPPSNASSKFSKSKLESRTNSNNKLVERSESFALGIREHVKLGPKITETMKGKLSLWAKIVRVGGITKNFKQNFSMGAGEKLLKVSQCYLSTTTGPIAGLHHISTDKVAFCSERTLKISSLTGQMIRIHYKVVIPLGKIKRANESMDVTRLSRKYIQIVTKDHFDFWFMGFLNYQKTFKYLDQAISRVQ